MRERAEERSRARKYKRNAAGQEVPGRRSASGELDAPHEPVPSGIIMRKASGETFDPQSAGSAIRRAEGSSSHGLPDELRARFESAVGMDLSHVRIHTGKESQDAARAVGAKAYAVGPDIHFAAGQYQPDSRDGQELIAHEVFHTLQAPQANAGDGTQVSEAHDSEEVEADRAASAMVVGQTTVAPTPSPSDVVRRKPNSYSAQEGLTWENGTALTEEEAKAWASQKATLAGAAGGYIAWATGFSITTGSKDLIKKLKQQGMRDYEKKLEALEHEVEGCEEQVDTWDEKRSSGMLWWKKTNPEAELNYQEWKKLLAKAKADLKAHENTQSAWEARVTQEATQAANTISSFAGSALKTAGAVGKELGITMPSQFKSIEDATGKIGKVTKYLNLGSKMFDTTALKNFQQNPSLETATAWANQVGNVFEAASGFAEGLPGGWGEVISSMMSMPSIVTKNFLAVMKKRYDAIDEQTRENSPSELLPEGGYSTPQR